ncbi:hypothetical protein HN018_23605 (plasmid) [Lichenicola cladoniae]|uniref:Uncharacterized protein n=1 Tax=Lichenicola cladoniae TaxID=1484109 RepID=A0A6M8HXC6_9PROT|nr:hypothetical protein [Lichenicola cladoniae]NPD66293.1 hypothetical protein [Acetobacteraceae bacterium]QKE93173.1 hypothetical protein HN018_23605 [Lichenicola cladoniae]
MRRTVFIDLIKDIPEMIAMSPAQDLNASRHGSRYHARLEREALAYGAATRRARARAIEDDIDHACEIAALGGHRRLSVLNRAAWDKRAWARYLAEAVRQAHAHCTELDGLRQEAAQLERLARINGTTRETD